MPAHAITYSVDDFEDIRRVILLKPEQAGKGDYPAGLSFPSPTRSNFASEHISFPLRVSSLIFGDVGH